MLINKKRLIFLTELIIVIIFFINAQDMVLGENNIDISKDILLKWIGTGIQEKTINMEMLFGYAMFANNTNFDGKYDYKTTSARFSLEIKPKNIIDIKLSMPFLLRNGPDAKTGPFGDLSADISKGWGKTNKIITGITLTFPTGFSAIKKDDNDIEFISSQLQVGSGLFSSIVRAGYAFMPQWGAVNIGVTYLAGILAVRTKEYGYDTISDKIFSQKKQLEFARDGWGAKNEMGTTRPDYLGIYTDLGIKTETVNHGISIGYFYPCSADKYEKYEKGITENSFSSKTEAQYFFDTLTKQENEKYFVAGKQAQTDNWIYLRKTTIKKSAFPSLTLQYNIEKKDFLFPVFLGTAIRFDYEKRLNLGGITLGVGFKFPIY
jgi:hypothetical protein